MKTSNDQNGEVFELLASASISLQLIFCFMTEKEQSKMAPDLNEDVLSRMSFMDLIHAFNRAGEEFLKNLIGIEISIRVSVQSSKILSDSLIAASSKKIKTLIKFEIERRLLKQSSENFFENFTLFSLSELLSLTTIKKFRVLIRDEIERRTIQKYNSLVSDVDTVMKIKQKKRQTKKDKAFLGGFNNRRYESIDSEVFSSNGFPVGCDDLVIGIFDAPGNKSYLSHYGPGHVKKIAREKMLKNLIKIGTRSNDEPLIAAAFKLTVLDTDVLDEKNKLMYADSSIWFNFGLRGSKKGSKIRSIIFNGIFDKAKGKIKYELCSLVLDCKELFSQSEIDFAYDQITAMSDNFNQWLRVFKEDLSREEDSKKTEKTFIKCITWCLRPEDFKITLEIANERYPHTMRIIEENLRRIGGSMMLFELFKFKLKNFEEISGENRLKRNERFYDQVEGILLEIKSSEVDFNVLSRIHQETLCNDYLQPYSTSISFAMRSLGEEYMSFIAEQGLKFVRKPKEKK